jgi:type I restriction enzyme S subunit
MKTLIKTLAQLQAAGRWDIDFHLPSEGIRRFTPDILKRVDTVAFTAKDKRDPTKKPDELFHYIDISSVDVTTGTIVTPQEITGEEAPSRARKVVRAFDILVSTCRPTRGAIAVVPVELHNQIASTGFSVVRANVGVNPYYLHYALRLASTLEQFRKWSTGSSYPAILDDDVNKTLIPVPLLDVQDTVAHRLDAATHQRDNALKTANAAWQRELRGVEQILCGETSTEHNGLPLDGTDSTEAQIRRILAELPPLTIDNGKDYPEAEAQEFLYGESK